jgi:protein TonB
MNLDSARSSYELHDELARLCLPSANRDPNRNLAWINSICLLFLIIGLVGAKPVKIAIRPVPPVEEIVPVVIEAAPPPPQTVTPDNREQDQDQQQPDAAQVVVVTAESPAINFSVPTIGTLVVPNAVAVAPPLKPMQPPVAVRSQPHVPSSLFATGAGGERPQPPYPKLALDDAEQGTVTLLMVADDSGGIISVEVKNSSGYPILDRSTVDYVRRHWRLPAGAGTRMFQTSITYRLQAG